MRHVCLAVALLLHLVAGSQPLGRKRPLPESDADRPVLSSWSLLFGDPANSSEPDIPLPPAKRHRGNEHFDSGKGVTDDWPVLGDLECLDFTDAFLLDILEGPASTEPTPTAYDSQLFLDDQHEHFDQSEMPASKVMDTVSKSTSVAEKVDLVDRQAPNNDFVVTPAPVTTTTSTYSTPTVQAPAMNPWSEWRETLLEKKTVGNNFSMKDERIRQYVWDLCNVLAEYSKPVKPPSLSPYACPSCYLLHQFEQHLRMAAIRVRDEYIQTGLEVNYELVRLCGDPPEFFELPSQSKGVSKTQSDLLRMKMARHLHSLVDEQFGWNAPLGVVFHEITNYSRTVFEKEKLCLANTQPEVVAQAPVCNDGPINVETCAGYRASPGEEVVARRDRSLQLQLDICKYLDVFKEFNKTIPCPPSDHLYVLVHHMGASIRDAAVLISKSTSNMKYRQFRKLAGEFAKKWLARLSSDLPACFASPEDLDPQTKERNLDGMIDYLYKLSFQYDRNIDFTQELHGCKTVRIKAISRLARKLFRAETRVADHLSGESRVQVME